MLALCDQTRARRRDVAPTRAVVHDLD